MTYYKNLTIKLATLSQLIKPDLALKIDIYCFKLATSPFKELINVAFD